MAAHSIASAGASTVRPGMARMMARSWTSWCVLPGGPVSTPEYDAPIFTLECVCATSMRTWSSARWVKKTANDESQGTYPTVARPAATPTMFCSAMPISKKRSGYARANASAFVEVARSASRTRTSGFVRASSTRVSAQASRGAFTVGGRPAVLLQPVLIHDRGEVAQAVPGGHVHRLPDHALLALTVAEHDEGVTAQPAHPRAEREAPAPRHPPAERAGGGGE